MNSNQSNEVNIPETPEVHSWGDIKFQGKSIDLTQTEVFYRDDGYISSSSAESY